MLVLIKFANYDDRERFNFDDVFFPILTQRYGNGILHKITQIT